MVRSLQFRQRAVAVWPNNSTSPARYRSEGACLRRWRIAETSRNPNLVPRAEARGISAEPECPMNARVRWTSHRRFIVLRSCPRWRSSLWCSTPPSGTLARSGLFRPDSAQTRGEQVRRSNQITAASSTRRHRGHLTRLPGGVSGGSHPHSRFEREK